VREGWTVKANKGGFTTPLIRRQHLQDLISKLKLFIDVDFLREKINEIYDERESIE